MARAAPRGIGGVKSLEANASDRAGRYREAVGKLRIDLEGLGGGRIGRGEAKKADDGTHFERQPVQGS